MNRWNIPYWLENKVINRDKKCVYCGIKFSSDNIDKRFKATWEHIINDAKIINEKNIALCCSSCNASKGAKGLSEWMNSNYCSKKNINGNTVADIVKQNIAILKDKD